MPRNGGSTVDVSERTVLGRNGDTHPLDDLVVSPDGLYFARSMDTFYFWYHECWIVPAQSWVINRFGYRPERADAVDWYIEPDDIGRDGDLWRVRDQFLDVFVHEGVRYHVDDADELAEALERQEITARDAARALRALDRLCDELRANGCSGYALLHAHAPTLPDSRLTRDPGGVFALSR